MILIESVNRVLLEAVTDIINWEASAGDDEEKKGSGERDQYDSRLADFDDCLYRIQVPEEDRTKLIVSIAIPCFSKCAEVGAEKYLEEAFPGMSVEAPQGFDHAIQVDLTALPEDKDALCQNLGRIKAIIVGAPYRHFFEGMLAGESASAWKFDIRRDTTVFFFPSGDRVTIVYALEFRERTDRAIAKVMMQEFVDVRRRERELGRAPPVAWGTNPPMELQEFNITENQGELGYITFSIMKGNVEGDRIQTTTDMMSGFRTFFLFHIKAAKSYFHESMRQKCRDLLKVLNRAKVKPEEEKKAMKTASGKTFNRK